MPSIFHPLSCTRPLHRGIALTSERELHAIFDGDIVHDDYSHDGIPKWAFHVALMKLTEAILLDNEKIIARGPHACSRPQSAPKRSPEDGKRWRGGFGASRHVASSEMGNRSCFSIFMCVGWRGKGTPFPLSKHTHNAVGRVEG